jgi:hypothetical protein
LTACVGRRIRVGLGRRSPDRRTVAIQLALVVLAVLVLLPAMRGGDWFSSHEEGRYPALVDHFQRSFFAGHLYPRWIPDLYGGYGYPTFCFYQPGFFFFTLPFAFLGRYPLYTLYATTILLLYLGALGAYGIGAILGDRRVGVFCAAMFLLTPYVCLDLYVRGDLSELTGLLLCPWPLYFLLVIAHRVRAGRPVYAAALGFACSVALVVISHPAVALFCLPAVSLIAAWHGLEAGLRRRYYVPVALGLVVGLALSAPYWVTLLQLRSAVNLERVTRGYSVRPEWNVVEPWRLVARRWGWAGSIYPSQERISFQLGAFHLVLATIGAVADRRSRIVQASYVTYLALVLLMTPFAAWVWLHAGPVRTIQFPWRILSVTAALQVVCIAGLGKLSTFPFIGRRLGLVLAAVLLAAFGWHRNQFAIRRSLSATDTLVAHRAQRFTRMTNLANLNEFQPKTVRNPKALVPRGDVIPIVEPVGDAAVEPLDGNDLYRIEVLVTASQPAGVRINQLYFPGWRVLVDGRDVAPTTLEQELHDDGRIMVAVPPGSHRLEAFYDGPPGWRLRNTAIALVLLGFAALWRRQAT